MSYPETAVTVERSGPGWLVTVERGNAEDVQTMHLTEMERHQLGAMLSGSGRARIIFRDVTAPGDSA